MPIKHLIWDFDGTLFDTYPAFIQAFQSALADFGYTGDAEMIHQAALISLSHCAAVLAAEFNLQPEAVEEAFGRSYTQIPYTQQPPMPGARELCEYIFQAGGKNLMVTHRGRRSSTALLELYDLKVYFSDIIQAEDAFPSKPDPSSFLAIIHRNGIDPRETMAVGDRLIDVQAGRGAGTRTCLLGSLEPTAQPDYRVDHLSQLIAILKRESFTA